MKRSTSSLLRRQGTHKGNHYFKHFYKGWQPPWFHNTKLKRPQISTICRMRSNHFNLNESLNRKNIIASPLCECGQKQTLTHIFWLCPNYRIQRAPLIKALRLQNIHTFNINELLISPSSKTVYLLHNYLKRCNLKI